LEKQRFALHATSEIKIAHARATAKLGIYTLV